MACDASWISFCAAVVSRDGDYFRSRIPLAETRALISKYAEGLEATDTDDKKSEEELIADFYRVFVKTIKPVFLINPENQFANTILNIAPPLRRELGIVSFSVNAQSSIVEAQFTSIDSKYDAKSDILAEMSSAARKCSTDSY